MHNFNPKCFAYQNILVNVRRPHMGTHGLNWLNGGFVITGVRYSGFFLSSDKEQSRPGQKNGSLKRGFVISGVR